MAPIAHAQTFYYWDGTPGTANGLSNGGTGNWSTSTSNWDIGTGYVSWPAGPTPNPASITAVFGGTAATVSLTEAITVGGLQFSTTAYTIASGTFGLSFGGTNNSILLNNVAAATISGTVGGSGNVSFATSNPATAGTVTFTGASTGGWSGTTTIGPAMTVIVDGTFANGALANTTGITLNGGSITTGSGVVSGNNTFNYINDSAGITVNSGGSITYRPINAGPTYNEVIGAVTVNSGQMSFFTGTLSSGTATLTINTGGITQNSSSSTLVFSTGNGSLLTGTFNLIRVTGAVTTPGWANGATSNPIIGPWATSGTVNTSTSDYVVYNGNSVVPAATAASAQSTWSDPTRQYTATAGLGGVTLTGTRNILALRSASNVTAGTATSGNANITLTGHTFAVGDALTITTGNPTGFSNLQVYFVVATATNTFQLSAIPNGTAITPTSSTSPQMVGVTLLSTGNNLGTTGILNGVNTAMTIAATGTGAVTLPSTTSANLFVTAFTNQIQIFAPIQDNGAGVLTLVKSGSNTLTLGAANTYTGGTILNSGTLTTTADNQLGIGGGITVNGAATWNTSTATSVTYNRNITINDAAVLTIASGNGGKTFTGVLTGNGSYINSATTSYFFTNTGNTFTGSVNSGYETQFASLGDSSNPINLSNSNSQFTWIGGAKTFAQRPFTLNGTGATAGQILSSGTGALIIQQPIAISGTAGARTLTLGGSYVGNSFNQFTGNIADGVGSAVSLTKSGSGYWGISGNLSLTGGISITGNGITTLSGTNTYSGNTSFSASGPILVLAGSQAVSPNTTFITNTNASTAASTIYLLDDTGGVNNSSVSLPNTFSIQNSNAPGNAHTFFVGNNNAANLGTGSGTTTGSTIAIGTLNWISFASGTTAYGPIQIQGANGYRLQINNVTLFNANNVTANTNTNTTFTPTTANLTLGTVTMATGNNALGVPFLVLDGTSLDNRITGVISNATDALTTGRPLNVTKSNLSTWTLSGANNYTGATTVTGGKLIVNGSVATGGAVTVSGGALGGTGTVNGAVTVSGTGGINLADGAVGTLTLGNTLSMTGAANANNLILDLGNATNTTDLIVAGGATSVTTAGSAVIYLNQLGGVAGRNAAGTYNLIQGTTSMAAATQFALATTKAFGQTFALGVSGSNLQLTTTQVTAGAGNVTLTGTSWIVTTNFTPNTLPDYQSNVTVNTAIGTSNLNASQDINSLAYGTGATTATTIAAGTAASGTPFNMLVIEAAGINGNTAGNGITVSNTNAINHTISANIGLASSQTWTVSNSTTGLIVSGVVSDFGGGYSLTKAGAGTLTLSGANTYSGGTTINTGTLKVGNAVGLGDNAGAVSVTSGAVLDLNGTTMTGLNPLTLNGTGISSGGALINSSATAATYAGLVTLGSNTTITATSGAITLSNAGTINGLGFNLIIGGNSSVTISSVLALGSGSITKNGNGTLTLNGATGTTGGIAVNGGILTAVANAVNPFGAPNNTLTLATGATLSLNQNTFSNPISIQNSAAVTISSGNSFGSTIYGSITLGSGSTTSFSGSNNNSITVTGVINGSGNLTRNNNGNGSSTILTAANTFTGNTVIATNTATGAATLTLSNPLALQNSILDTNSSAVGGTLNGLKTTVTMLTLGGLSGNKDLSSLFTTTAGGYSGVTALTLNPNASQSPSYSAAIADGATGMSLTKTGAGTQTLSGTNTNTGSTNVSAGTLLVNNPGSLAVGSTVAVNGGTLGGTGTVSGSVTVNPGGLLRGDSGSGTGTLITGAVTIKGFTASGGALATMLPASLLSSGSITGNSGITTNSITFDSTGGAFNIVLLGDGGLTDGAPYSVTLATGTSASYTGFTNGSTPNFNVLSGSGAHTYNPGDYSLAQSGNTLLLNFVPSAVPEPGTILGIAAAGFGLGRLVRRRIRKAQA